MNKRMALTAIFLSLFLAPVHAAPVTWTIDSLLFDDGGTGSGSFDYDADSNSYTNISIVTTAGSVLSGATYSYLNPSFFGASSSTGLVVVSSLQPDLTGLPGMGLVFASPLSNTGGVIQITAFIEAFCSDAVCNAPSGLSRGVVSGQISAVPIPAAVWLFASGLGLLGWLRRKSTV